MVIRTYIIDIWTCIYTHPQKCIYKYICVSTHTPQCKYTSLYLFQFLLGEQLSLSLLSHSLTGVKFLIRWQNCNSLPILFSCWFTCCSCQCCSSCWENGTILTSPWWFEGVTITQLHCFILFILYYLRTRNWKAKKTKR